MSLSIWGLLCINWIGISIILVFHFCWFLIVDNLAICTHIPVNSIDFFDIRRRYMLSWWSVSPSRHMCESHISFKGTVEQFHYLYSINIRDSNKYSRRWSRTYWIDIWQSCPPLHPLRKNEITTWIFAISLRFHPWNPLYQWQLLLFIPLKQSSHSSTKRQDRTRSFLLITLIFVCISQIMDISKSSRSMIVSFRICQPPPFSIWRTNISIN